MSALTPHQLRTELIAVRLAINVPMAQLLIGRIKSRSHIFPLKVTVIESTIATAMMRQKRCIIRQHG